MLPIQTIMAPLADQGLRLHVYPHPEQSDKWVIAASTLHGDKQAHVTVDGRQLASAFPAEGGKFLAERVSAQNIWILKLYHGEEEVLVREFPPDTSIMTALKEFFRMPLMMALMGPLQGLIAKMAAM